MKVLLDHCVPRPFERLLEGHEVIHTSRVGWGALKNGALLSAAEAAGFSVLVTVDQGIPFQQNLSNRAIAIVLLRAKKNDLASLRPFAEPLLGALDELTLGSVSVVSDPDEVV